MTDEKFYGPLGYWPFPLVNLLLVITDYVSTATPFLGGYYDGYNPPYGEPSSSTVQGKRGSGAHYN